MRLPSDVGIDPVKLQSLRAKTFKDFRLPIESGNSPKKLISEKSKNFRVLLLQLNFGRELSRYSFSPRWRVCILGRQRKRPFIWRIVLWHMMPFQVQQPISYVCMEKHCRGWNVLSDNAIVGGGVWGRKDLNSRCLRWKYQIVWVELQSYKGSWRGMWRWIGIGEKVRKLKDNWLPTPTSFEVTFPCKFLKEDACVSELLDHAFVWKSNLVDVIFLFHKAALFKCLPLSKWHSHLDG